MFKAVLFDLDGTLLPVDTDTFLQVYLRLLSQATAPYIKPEVFVPKLLEATYKMVADKDPGKTNEQVFLEEFFAGIDLEPEVLMPVFERFYQTDYCSLADFCTPEPLVPLLVKEALARCKTVIATNPVFPYIAVEERLRWVGIAGLPYALITSYENMHYCKPHLEYYLEILEAIKVEPQECLMVGNDVDEDLVVREIGMKTFLIDSHLINRTNRHYETDYQGSLRDCFDFITGL